MIDIGVPSEVAEILVPCVPPSTLNLPSVYVPIATFVYDANYP